MLFSGYGLNLIPFERGSFHRGCKSRAESNCVWYLSTLESGCLKVQPKVGDKLHLRLNMSVKSIVDKYREGKLQRTLKREFNRA